MTTNQLVRGIVLAGLVMLAPLQPASAGLQIDLVFIDNAPPPPPSLIVGGGNLQEIMQAAAEAWERVFQQRRGGNWKLTIEYGWAPLGGGLYGKETLLTQGGHPARITRSLILFSNSPGQPDGEGIPGFFADPTPRENSEYLRYTTDIVNVGTGWLNVGRVFSEATGHAADRIDLLTIATHEIGHALGLDYEYVEFFEQHRVPFVEVEPPLPFAGFSFIIENGPHIDALGQTPLMVQRPHAGQRQLISAADALLIAQVSSFPKPNLAEPPLHLDDDHHGRVD